MTMTTKTVTPSGARSFNLADLFESVADLIPDREALISGKQRLTYARLEERANRLANWLRARGVGAGDHVGLYLYNGHEYIEALLAAFKLRAVPININYRYVEGELRYLCSNADLVALLYQPELRARVDGVAGDLPKLRLRLAVGDEYEAALASSSPARDFPQRSGDDLYIIYTGGTTGLPRGVMWRHEDVFFAGLQGGNPGGEPLQSPAELAPLAESGFRALTYLPAAPFIHGAAQWAALIGLNGGGKVVISPGPHFDAKRVCRLLGEEQVTALTLVGDAMARPLADALAADATVDTSSLMVIASAGAILSRSVQDELQARLPSTMILNNFGATETGHQGNAAGQSGARPRFFFDGTTAVLDENLRPLPPGSGAIGKVARRGRIPVGYYNDPEKTAATFLTIDGERWVMPGDLATVEEDGSITVLGRGAVCINSGGEKIFPEEVEEALKAHPAVLDAVVVGVPDARWGERVAALVQPRPDADPTQLTLKELDAHLRPRIAGYKVPRELHVVAEVVRHPSGKPDYRWAKAEAQSRQAAADGSNGDSRGDRARYWYLATVKTEGAWAAVRRLAAAVHELAERCVAADPLDDAHARELDAVAAAVAAQSARLAELPTRASRAAFHDGTYQKNAARFMDRSPLIGHANPIAPPLVLSPEGETAVGRAVFGTVYEGMPGFVHGGILAAAFDQMFGYVGVLRGVPALTGSLTVRYRKPTPLGVELRFEATLDRIDGRKSFVRGRCLCNGEVTADAEALFVVIGPEGFAQLMSQP
jgi:acyl-CoA synthetase (AMP-forming)/AMP-acid ligase II/acyl-coenzyme A thioesterase PaaI-like protein